MAVNFNQLDNTIYRSVFENLLKVTEGNKNRQLEGQKAVLAANVARSGQNIQADSAAASLRQLTESQGLQRDTDNTNSLRTQQTALTKEKLIQGRHEDTFGLDVQKEGFAQEAETERLNLDDRRVDLLEQQDARKGLEFDQEQTDRTNIREAGAKYGLNGIKEQLIAQGHADEALNIDKTVSEINNNILNGAKSTIEIKGAEAKFQAGKQTKDLVDMASAFIASEGNDVAKRQLVKAMRVYDAENGTNFSDLPINQLSTTVVAMAAAKQKGLVAVIESPELRETMQDFVRGYFEIKTPAFSNQGKEAKDAENFSGIDVGAPSVVINTNGTASVQESSGSSNFDTNMGGSSGGPMSFKNVEWD